MWIYEQSTGRLLWDGAMGSEHVTTGYSGFGEHQNNPLSQHLANLGPLPLGQYLIGEAFKSDHSGPITMRLIPQTGTNTYGRSAFEIHGFSKDHPLASSHGCICIERDPRERVSVSDNRQLTVVSGKTISPK